MTRAYFVRHAQPDNTVRDDRMRPLTDEGKTTRFSSAISAL